jgi:putative transcriptional regulator
MPKRDIGKEIIQGLEEIKAWKRGRLKLRTVTVALPRAADVAAIRRQLGLSQEQFATFMGVSVATLRNWEQARREPHGPARALLLVAAKQPRAVREALKAAMPPTRAKSHAERLRDRTTRKRWRPHGEHRST